MATPSPQARKIEPPPSPAQIKLWAEANNLRPIQGPTEKSLVAVDGSIEGQHFTLMVRPPALSYVRHLEVRARWRFRITGGLMGGIVSRPLFNLLRDTKALKAFNVGGEIEEERVIRAFDETTIHNPAVRRHYAAFGNMAKQAEEWIDDEFAKMLLFWPNGCYEPGQPFMLLVVNGQLMLVQQLNHYPVFALNHVMRTIKIATSRASKVFGQSDTYR